MISALVREASLCIRWWLKHRFHIGQNAENMWPLVADPKLYIYIILFPNSQGILKKKREKECKNQRLERSADGGTRYDHWTHKFFAVIVTWMKEAQDGACQHLIIDVNGYTVRGIIFFSSIATSKSPVCH